MSSLWGAGRSSRPFSSASSSGVRCRGAGFSAPRSPIVGIALLAFGGHGSPNGGGAVIPGIPLGLLAGLSYALYTWASSRAIATGQPSRGVMGGMFGLGAIVLLPVLLALGAPLLQSAQSIGVAAYLALGPMFVAYLLFGIGMRTLRSSTATTIHPPRAGGRDPACRDDRGGALGCPRLGRPRPHPRGNNCACLGSAT